LTRHGEVKLTWPSRRAVSLAFPSARFDRDLLPTWVGAMSATVAMIQRDLLAAA
jgi:hypothetical protein